MSKNDKETIKLLDTKLDDKTTKTMVTCAVIMLVAVLIHDGDHIRQAINWGYTSIPLRRRSRAVPRSARLMRFCQQ